MRSLTLRTRLVLAQALACLPSVAAAASPPRHILNTRAFTVCPMASSSRPLKTVSTPPSSGKHVASVVFLHGSGDTGPGIQAWVQSELPSFSFQGVNVVYPTAHQRPYSLLGPSGVQHVWFDRKALLPEAEEDVAGIDAMAKLVRRVIDDEVDKGVPLEKIVLGGFSMGGGQALHTAMGDPELAGRLAGVFVLSSFLQDATVTTGRAREHPRVPPVLQFHGDKDLLIWPVWGRDSNRRLAEATGGGAEYREYEGLAHEVRADELSDLKGWIQQRLGED